MKSRLSIVIWRHDSALSLAYDYIVTQNKNNTDIIYLNIVVKDTPVTFLKQHL